MTTHVQLPRLRFLDLYHLEQVVADDIHDAIEAWHSGTGPDRHVELHVALGLDWPEYTRWAGIGELPTAKEHRHSRWDAALMEVDGRQVMVQVHPSHRCRPACPVHWPTDHPLAGSPKWWDPVEGIMRRTCSHDVDHPDPDDQQVRLHPVLNRHDCDGCCTATVVAGDFYEPDEPVEQVLTAFRNGLPSITRRPS